jgi:hypothetical protein
LTQPAEWAPEEPGHIMRGATYRQGQYHCPLTRCSTMAPWPSCEYGR